MTTNQCGIVTCKKKFRENHKSCNNCHERYCSAKCFEIHLLLCKLQTRDTSQKKTLHFDIKGSMYKKSPFIKNGEYLKIVPENNQYDLDSLKMYTDKVIGKGIYGDIYLAKHIESNKFLAIKQVN